MAIITGICQICGKPSNSLQVCRFCGAQVCPECYVPEKNACKICAGKFGLR